MREEDFDDFVGDMFFVKNSMDQGLFNSEVLELIDDRLVFINACLDAMPSTRKELNEEKYTLVLRLADEFYRLRDRFVSGGF